jgi:hypothetical protein
MPNRLGYGASCQPIFFTHPNPLYQGGGGKEKPNDCGCDEKAPAGPPGSLPEMWSMTGGSPISQFSTIAATSSIFTPMGINQIIPIILLLFAHAYLTRNYKPPSSPSGSHRDRILGGGEVDQITPTPIQDSMTGGGDPGSLLAPILVPFGPANLVAIAAILLLHYFATRREKMMKMSGGGESMSAFQTESIFEKEIKIHQMLGGHSLYRELEEVFLTPESSVGGGLKGKSRSRKMAKLIEPVGYDKFKAPSFIKDLKNLFRHYYYTIYKEKPGKAKKGKGKKMDGGAKQKQMAHSKRSVKSFQRIYDMIAPIAVALTLRKQQRKQKKRSPVKSK